MKTRKEIMDSYPEIAKKMAELQEKFSGKEMDPMTFNSYRMEFDQLSMKSQCLDMELSILEKLELEQERVTREAEMQKVLEDQKKIDLANSAARK